MNALQIAIERVTHHGRGIPSRKKPREGPSSGSVAAQTMLRAPSSMGLPPLPPMSVAVQPGQIEFTRIPLGLSSEANMHVTAFRAALEML